MEITTLVPILLPIVLFIITLIILMVMRDQDNHKRGVANVRKLTDQLKTEIASHEDEFRAEIAEFDEKLAQKDAQIQSYFQEIDSKLKNIETYATDLGRMKAAMETYREALCGLAKLTQDADSKISSVEDEVERLDEVRKVIDGFKMDMKDADDHLKQHEGTVIQMERDTMNRLEDRCKSLSEDFSIKIDRLCDQLDIKVEATRDATETLMNQGAEVLGNIGDRTAEQVQLASQVRELTRQKERLLSEISSLNKTYEEKEAELAKPYVEPVKNEPVEKVVEQTIEEVLPEVETEKVEENSPFDDSVDVEIEEKIEYEGEEEEIVFD